MYRLHYLYLLLMPFAFVACQQGDTQHRLDQIDSLEQYIPEVEASLTRVDSVKLQSRLTSINDKVQWIFDNISDTLPPKLGMVVGEYMGMKKQYSRLAIRRNEIAIELATSKKQLSDLRRDVGAQFYSKEEFNEYFEVESESMANLVEASNEMVNGYGFAEETIKTKRVVVDSLIEATRAIIYAPEKID